VAAAVRTADLHNLLTEHNLRTFFVCLLTYFTNILYLPTLLTNSFTLLTIFLTGCGGAAAAVRTVDLEAVLY